MYNIIQMLYKILNYLFSIYLFFELYNWFSYLCTYINLANSLNIYIYTNDDVKKIIKKMDKLSTDEINYVIKGCIMYDKYSHCMIDYTNFDIKNLSKKEITHLIGFSIFGLEIDQIHFSSECLEIYNLINKIENKLQCEFKINSCDRYLYRKWGCDYIKFNFRPLLLQIPIKLWINAVHYLLIFKYQFKYKITNSNKIAFMYNLSDPNKETLFFIHGFGFGYTPYISTLLKLGLTYNLVIVIIPNISSQNHCEYTNSTYFPPLDNFSASIYDFIDNNKCNKCVLCAHSFGTYFTQILRNDPRIINFQRIILIDPIIFWFGCFKMSIYVENPNINVYSSTKEYLFNILINYLIFECFYLKYVCYRIMFGPDFLIYDADELNDPKISLVFEKYDHILPAELLFYKMKSHNKCYLIDDAQHGSILLNSKYIDKLIDIIK